MILWKNASASTSISIPIFTYTKEIIHLYVFSPLQNRAQPPLSAVPEVVDLLRRDDRAGGLLEDGLEAGARLGRALEVLHGPDSPGGVPALEKDRRREYLTMFAYSSAETAEFVR